MIVLIVKFFSSIKMVDLNIAEEWDSLVANFDECVTKYRFRCCEGEHSIDDRDYDDSYIWTVEKLYLDYDVDLDYQKVCYCKTREIAIREACLYLFYEDERNLFNGCDIFSKRGKKIAILNNKLDKLLSMQQQMYELVQCTKCYSIDRDNNNFMQSDPFNRQSGSAKVIVEPMTIISTLESFYDNDSDSDNDNDNNNGTD